MGLSFTQPNTQQYQNIAQQPVFGNQQPQALFQGQHFGQNVGPHLIPHNPVMGAQYLSLKSQLTRSILPTRSKRCIALDCRELTGYSIGIKKRVH
jgi:hypothetical protein